MGTNESPYKILFVCLGNICRSPTAEGIMNEYIKKRQLEGKIYCDSAGTADYHEGALPGSRMREEAQKRGYYLTSRSRPVRQDDFKEFDLILSMDNDNYANLISLEGDKGNRFKIKKMVDFSNKLSPSHVPDPYYGGSEGFREVIDILEDSLENLLSDILKNHLGP